VAAKNITHQGRAQQANKPIMLLSAFTRKPKPRALRPHPQFCKITVLIFRLMSIRFTQIAAKRAASKRAAIARA